MMFDSKSSDLFLSQSLIIKGLRCHKYLYLKKFHPDLSDFVPPAKLSLSAGRVNIECCAQKLFPGGVDIGSYKMSLEKRAICTESEISGGASILYNPVFAFDGLFVTIDILCKVEDGWAIYDVRPSTGVKSNHVKNLSVQYYVLSNINLPVVRIYLVHIDRRYVREGDLEHERLFETVDLTGEVKEKQEDLYKKIERIKEMLNEDMPEIDIGAHCFATYACDFMEHCWQHIPDDSIFSLRGKGINKFELYQQGIIDLKDVPAYLLSGAQKTQMEATLDRKDFIDTAGAGEFLDSLWYPMYFLDLEILVTPVPMFDGTSPYQQIPFQYSLHYIDIQGAKLGHSEFLAPAGVDCRKELLEKLMDEIPENACVIVYGKSFEQRMLNDLGKLHPEHMPKISNIIENMRDAAEPFRKRDVYFWKMNGSYSLKSVLPALVPELSYDELEICDGRMAMEAYRMICYLEDEEETERIRGALLEYCKLDTLAMVKILEKIRELCSV